MGEIHAHTLAAEKLFRTQEENFEVDPHVVGIEDVTRGLGLEPGDAERIQRLVQDTNPEFKAKSQTQRLFHARGRLLDTMKHSMKHVPSDLREQVLKRALQFWKKTYQTDYGKDATLRWGGAGNTMKSTRFVIPLDLAKASKGSEKAGHKYLSRKPDGKGAWDYVYKHPAGHDVAIKVRARHQYGVASTYESLADDGRGSGVTTGFAMLPPQGTKVHGSHAFIGLDGQPVLTHDDHTDEHTRAFHEDAVRDAYEAGDSDVKVVSAVRSKVPGVNVGITQDGRVIGFKSKGYDQKGNVAGPRVDVTDLARGTDAFYSAFLTLDWKSAPALAAAEPAILSKLKNFADHVNAEPEKKGAPKKAAGPKGYGVRAHSEHMETIAARRYDGEARAMEKHGVSLTHDQADEIGDEGVGWMKRRLGLEFTTDDRGVHGRPRAKKALTIPASLFKASKGSEKAGHKYKSRKPNGKGGFDYVYEHPEGHEIAVSTERGFSNDKFESYSSSGDSKSGGSAHISHTTENDGLKTFASHADKHVEAAHHHALQDTHQNQHAAHLSPAHDPKFKPFRDSVNATMAPKPETAAEAREKYTAYLQKLAAHNAENPTRLASTAMSERQDKEAAAGPLEHPDNTKAREKAARRKAPKSPYSKKGAYGTLHLHEVKYTDPANRSDGEQVSQHWGYDSDHALEKFHDSNPEHNYRIAGVTRKRQEKTKKALATPASLFKAEKGSEKAGHLYTKRIPDGKGGWHYDYGPNLTRHLDKVKLHGEKQDVHSAHITNRGKVVTKTHPEFSSKDHERAAASHHDAAKRAGEHSQTAEDKTERDGAFWAHRRHLVAAQGHEQAAKTVKGREKRSAAAQRKYDKAREPINEAGRKAKAVADAKHNQALRDKREGNVIKLPGLAQPKHDAAAAKVEHVTIAQRGMHDGGGYRIKIGSEHEEALKDHPSWKMIKDKTFHDHGSAMDAAQKIFRHTKTVG